MNSGFLITDAGLAAATIATPDGPFIHITGFTVGSGFGYEATRDMVALTGTTLYTGVASSYTIVDVDTIEIMLIMPATVGTFNFGEIGLWLASGELFAVLTFETPQEKVRAIGNQAGNVWRIRSRIKLAQAPAIVVVNLINSQNILEVPGWAYLHKPGDQIMDANIAIVHDNNSSDDPVLVIRDTDDEWGLIDYGRMMFGATSDPGALLTGTTFTHPDLANHYFEGMPRTDSRYLIKFPNGAIRKVTNSLDPTQITFSPSVPTGQTGTVSVWEENGAGQRISWADTPEYNVLATDFNPYWANPVGPYRTAPNLVSYPAANKGKGQTPIPLLSRRTNSADWVTLMTAIRANCLIHGMSITDIAGIVDFIYRPVSPTFYSLQSLSEQYLALKAKLPLFQTNRNVFDSTYQDQSLLGTNVSTGSWYGTRTYRHAFTYSNEVHLQAQLNSGHEIRFNGSASSSGSYLAQIFNAIGSIILRHNAVTATTGSSTGIGLHELSGSFTQMWSHTIGETTLAVFGRRVGTVVTIELRVSSETAGYGYGGYGGFVPGPGYGGGYGGYGGPTTTNPGTVTLNAYSRRPASSLLNTPILAHPALTYTLA